MLATKGTAGLSSPAVLGKQALRLRGGGGGIQAVVAREVLDSRGNPTVEVRLCVCAFVRVCYLYLLMHSS